MDKNTKYLADKVADLMAANALMSVKIDILHRIVDKADVADAKSNWRCDSKPIDGILSCERIREIFGWSTCVRAEHALREAEGGEADGVVD